MDKKFKIMLSEHVVNTLDKLSEKEQKKLMKAINRIADCAERGKQVGKPFNPIRIRTWDNERCNCGKPYVLLFDKGSNEIDFVCSEGICAGFWCKKIELERGRNKFARRHGIKFRKDKIIEEMPNGQFSGSF